MPCPAAAITSNFQHQIPFVLQLISPSLAALHASRARLLKLPDTFPDPLASSHCLRCGAFLLNGSGTFRTLRKKKHRKKDIGQQHPSPRVFRRSCSVCGYADEESIGAGDLPRFPRVNKRRKFQSSKLPKVGDVSSKRESTPPVDIPAVPSQPVPFSNTLVPPHIPSSSPSPMPTHSVTPLCSRRSPLTMGATSPAPSRSKARPKKNRGLQDILARNRERQEEEKKSLSGDLSAFSDCVPSR